MPQTDLPAPLINVNDLRYRPLGSENDVLTGISLKVYPSDFILLLGPSGGGKSTLIRCLNGLIPHLDQGQMSGRVEIEGKDTLSHQIHEFSSIIGMVFQSPDDQILSLRVGGEVAFGLEVQGLTHDQIVARADEFMELMGISHLKDRLTFAISGGQKQRVSIASNLALLQRILVLDDPTTDLDPVGKSEIIRTLAKLRSERGMTLIVIEHDLNQLVELATRMVVMSDGRIAFDGPPNEVFAQHYDELVRLGVNVPQHIEMARLLAPPHELEQSFPVERASVFALLSDFLDANPGLLTLPPSSVARKGECVVSVRNLEFAYDPSAPVLKHINLEISRGEFVAIIGANGSGKSSLVGNLIGLLKPDEGQIIINGRDTANTPVAELVQDIGYVFQNPDHQLFAQRVDEELLFSLRNRGLTPEVIERRLSETLELVGLANYRSHHPLSLSRGQRQNLAVATALIHNPALMLLDEPTTGQDRRSLGGLLEMLSRLSTQGHTTIMVTHDMDIVAAYATRIIIMSDGEIAIDGDPRHVFYDHYDELAALNLQPPTIVDHCRRLAAKGCPRYLIVEELQASLEGRNSEASIG